VASNVSKSQLYRHFEDKQALVRAVIEFVGDRRIADQRERLSKVTTFAGLRRWRDALVETNALQEGRYGWPWGSFANEVADQDAIARQKPTSRSRRGKSSSRISCDVSRRGPLLTRRRRPAAATGLLAAVQGGYLLAQTARDVTPMASAIDMALAHLRMLDSAP
jgi:AcrR family transcriptional regulator